MGRGATGWEDRRRREATLGGSLVYGYLAAFNVVMAAGWCLVAATLVASAIYTGSPLSALHLAFTNVGSLVLGLQLLVCMEVVHMTLAWVPPSTMNPLLLLHCKVLRRLHLLVVAYFGVPQVHQTAALGFVFVHWAVVDLIRYPFYLLNMVRACPPLLKWMRYSEFIVMYPISFTSEMYLWWVMYPYIREWPLEQREGSLEAAAATLYGWLLLAYLAWRVSTFPFNYRRMLRLRGHKEGGPSPAAVGAATKAD